MASLLNRNGTYYIQFSDASKNPKLRRFSLKTKRKNVARRLLTDLEERFERGDFDPWTDTLTSEPPNGSELAEGTICDAIRAFVASKEEAGLKENSIRTYQEILSLLCRAVGSSKPLARITARDLSAFINGAELSGATKYKRYGHVRTFARWSVKTGRLTSNPLEDVPKPAKPRKIPKAVTRAELDTICETIRADYERKREAGTILEGELIWRIPAFRFSFFTGLRASELARLRWGHLDFGKGLIFIFEQKNGKQETVPLNGAAREALEGMEHGDADDYVFRSPRMDKAERSVKCFVNNLSRAFREARKAAEIDRPISLHGLRHGHCTALAEAGKSAMVIQRAARHADISTSARYVHIANEALKGELDSVFG